MKIKYTPLQIISELLSVALLLFSTLFIIFMWQNIPEAIPQAVENGVVTAYTAKNQLLIFYSVEVVAFGFLSVYCLRSKSWSIPVYQCADNKKAVYSAYRDLMLTFQFEVMLIFSLLLFFEVSASWLMFRPMWLIPTAIGVLLITLVLMFYRVHKTAESYRP